MSPNTVPAVVAIAELLILALIVLLVLFALGIIFAAIWYHFRQPKEVRIDSDEHEDGSPDDDTRRGV